MARKRGGPLYEAFVVRPLQEEARRRREEAEREAERYLNEWLHAIHRILIETYTRGKQFDAVNRWLKREIPKLVEKHAGDPKALLDALRTIRPPSLRGVFKRPRLSLLPSGEALLREFDELAERGRAEMRKANRLLALLDAFPDVPHEVLDRPGRFVPERFAKEALAEKYACSVRTVASTLREARKARPRPSSS